MKRRLTEAQISFALRQAEAGTPISKIIRKMGITEVTFYRWKKKCQEGAKQRICF